MLSTISNVVQMVYPVECNFYLFYSLFLKCSSDEKYVIIDATTLAQI